MTPRLAEHFLNERERWPLWLPVLFGLGIGIYFALPDEPNGLAGLSLLSVTALSAYVARRRLEMFILFACLAVIAAGFTAIQWRSFSVAGPVLAERHGPATVSGRIVKLENFPAGARLTLDKLTIAGLRPDQMPARVRVRLRGDNPDFVPGQWVRVRAVLTPPPEPVAPGAFDFQRQSYFRGLGGTGFVLGRAEIIAPASLRGLSGWRIRLEAQRQAIKTRVQNAIGGAPGAVAAALMTGDRSAIPADVMAAVRNSGLAHLLAISGLHIGLVAGILFVGVRALFALLPFLALRLPIKKWAALLAIVGAAGYAMMAGATVPTQRAFLMIGLVLAAVILDRRGLSMRLVAWAAAVILVLRPESLLGASFQMSFAAVIALIAAYETGRDRLRGGWKELPWWRRPALYLFGIAVTTLIASSATAPFAVYHFNRFAVFGLAANLVAVPLTALLIMPAAVISFLLMPLGADHLALIPMGWGTEAVIWVARTVAAWEGAVVLLPAMPTLGLAALAGGGLWLCLWRGRWRWWGAAPIAAGMATMLLVAPPDILVDGTGRLFAVRGDDGGYLLSTRRAARFSGDIWLRRLGQAATSGAWPKLAPSPRHRLTCDRLGCIAHLGKRPRETTVALVTDARALPEDCRRADIIISAVPVRRACPSAARVIDRFDLWRDGAHALWVGKDGVRIESVRSRRGDRPWVVKRPR